MTLLYCLKCKKKTNTNGSSEKISKNGRTMKCGICEICGTNKTMFVSDKKSGGCVPLKNLVEIFKSISCLESENETDFSYKMHQTTSKSDNPLLSYRNFKNV
jgi:hypothetical protein